MAKLRDALENLIDSVPVTPQDLVDYPPSEGIGAYYAAYGCGRVPRRIREAHHREIRMKKIAQGGAVLLLAAAFAVGGAALLKAAATNEDQKPRPAMQQFLFHRTSADR